ncbi:hypothetical protein D0Z07_3593 [Hyphodiscus hymeniophilus]|uniref:Uncharacterized protein n=1 Tax=Hyphodiscus hymeniophilus TaxID=353542 RepID=A0A9P7AY05_9HELO|nr:hypothetical protein D0Z07_3593 [Hyphodiscus hymeniophilus]
MLDVSCQFWRGLLHCWFVLHDRSCAEHSVLSDGSNMYWNGWRANGHYNWRSSPRDWSSNGDNDCKRGNNNSSPFDRLELVLPIPVHHKFVHKQRGLCLSIQ